MGFLAFTSHWYNSTQHEITTGTYTYDQSLRCAAADPSITFPVLAGGATQDLLTTIRDKVSGVMIRSGGLASVPLSRGASLLGAAGGDGRPNGPLADLLSRTIDGCGQTNGRTGPGGPLT